MAAMAQPALLELNPADLGTLDLGGLWVTYANPPDGAFLPTRLRIGTDEYDYAGSYPILGHGAVLPPRIRELRAAGKQVAIVESGERYVLFASG